MDDYPLGGLADAAESVRDAIGFEYCLASSSGWTNSKREDRQKSYADNRRKPLEFDVGDRVMLKVSPWKAWFRLGKKTLLFIDGTAEIMDREVKSLKRSKISLVKVRWDSKRGPEFTWECEDFMKSKYPQLFVDRTNESTN
ncbi:hypothetical protein Tco_0545808 [Tanacetum coccineum]